LEFISSLDPWSSTSNPKICLQGVVLWYKAEGQLYLYLYLHPIEFICLGSK